MKSDVHDETSAKINELLAKVDAMSPEEIKEFYSDVMQKFADAGVDVKKVFGLEVEVPVQSCFAKI